MKLIDEIKDFYAGVKIEINDTESEDKLLKFVVVVFAFLITTVMIGLLLLIVWEVAKALFPVAIAFVAVYGALVYFDKASMPKFVKKLLRK